MNAKILIPLMAAAVLTGCKVGTDSCPNAAQVPFECVEIPDSVKAGQEFAIDVKLYDYGCYTATKVVGGVNGDTVYLEAYANYDECGCPAQSVDLQVTYKTKTDTSLHNSTLYYVYMMVNTTKDSIMVCRDSVRFY
jgi:hypothetical protein